MLKKVPGALLLLLLTYAVSVSAETLYVTWFDWGVNSTLARVDLAQGTLEQIGETGNIGFAVEGLAYSEDGSLYGVDVLADLLIRIDLVTGIATLRRISSPAG